MSCFGHEALLRVHSRQSFLLLGGGVLAPISNAIVTSSDALVTSSFLLCS